MRSLLIPAFLLGCHWSFSQANDTTLVKELSPVNVQDNSISPLPFKDNVESSFIYSGKKNELVNISASPAGLSDKNARQLLAKVPGIFVYDMDGAGNQINVSTRGLDAHRGWEFNQRKDGVIINSDMYGYPASHFSPPLESIKEIQLVRGTGALQYGAQFGGMFQYISKEGDPGKKIGYEGNISSGSYNLIQTFNSLGGQLGKLNYYVYDARRSKDGYRDEEHTDYDAQGIILRFDATKKLQIRAEYSRSNYLYKMSGPLTDSMFHANPRAATRTRNYYSPTIHVPSLQIKWNAGKKTELHLVSSAILGERKSAMFDRPANVPDTISSLTRQYAARQVDVDNFNSYTQELRVTHRYALFNRSGAFVAGIQAMNNTLFRRQQGKGSTASDYDLTLTDGTWGRDLKMKSDNIALFLENTTSVTEKISVQLGARMESGTSVLSGSIRNYPSENIPLNIDHQYVLLGGSLQWKITKNIHAYGGFAQGYRPVLFKDIIPGSVYEFIDSNIKDAYGYNSEAGCRGAVSGWTWDVTYFRLSYQNKPGTFASVDESGQQITIRTNTGDVLSEGVEFFLQKELRITEHSALTLFTSTAWMNARYTKGIIRNGTENIDVTGNRLESAPEITSRNGVEWRTKFFRVGALYSYVAETYADALNQKNPNASGSTGLVPAYALIDAYAIVPIHSNIAVKINANNLADVSYFTKRPQLYPGGGVWPSDGRNFIVSVNFSL